MSTVNDNKTKGIRYWGREPKINEFGVSLTFNAAAAVQERSNVSFDGARAQQLVSNQIGVVGG